MSDDPLFNQAMDALRKQDRRQAREILTRLVKADNKNPKYWLWLSTTVDTPKETTYCLQEVLKYDPDNKIAQNGLIFHGVNKAAKGSENLFLKKLDWQGDLIKKLAPPPPVKEKKVKKKSSNPVIFAGIGIIVVAAILLAVYVPRLFPKNGPPVKLTRPTARLTATYLPTTTPKGFKASATPKGPISLSSLLEATYTPTPLYVNTPHSSEAYSLAMRSYEKGDWDNFQRYMEQMLASDPTQADIYFYLGEAERIKGNLNVALMQYEKAMNINPQFAPAILAHAQVLKLTQPKSKIIDDLSRAIDSDPELFEAYIERASYYLGRNQFDLAFEDLQVAKDLKKESPLVYLALAKAYLAKDQPALALENALKAKELDITMLDTYLLLGTAYIANGEPDKSLEPLQTYLTYKQYDANAYAMVGQAYWAAGDVGKAVENMDKSITMDTTSFDAFFIRGIANLQAGNPNGALDDLTKALELNDNSYDAVFARAQALLQLGRNTDSYNQYLRAVSLAETDTERAESTYLLARAALAVGDRSKITDAYKRLLSFAPGVVSDARITEANTYLHPCSGSKCPTATITPLVGPPIKTATP